MVQKNLYCATDQKLLLAFINSENDYNQQKNNNQYQIKAQSSKLTHFQQSSFNKMMMMRKKINPTRWIEVKLATGAQQIESVNKSEPKLW